MIYSWSCFILFTKSDVKTISEAPTVNPFPMSQLLTILWAVVINSFVAYGPIYSQIECTRPPGPDPTTYFWRAPDKSCPFLMIILTSLIFLRSSPLFVI